MQQGQANLTLLVDLAKEGALRVKLVRNTSSHLDIGGVELANIRLDESTHLGTTAVLEVETDLDGLHLVKSSGKDAVSGQGDTDSNVVVVNREGLLGERGLDLTTKEVVEVLVHGVGGELVVDHIKLELGDALGIGEVKSKRRGDDVVVTLVSVSGLEMEETTGNDGVLVGEFSGNALVSREHELLDTEFRALVGNLEGGA